MLRRPLKLCVSREQAMASITRTGSAWLGCGVMFIRLFVALGVLVSGAGCAMFFPSALLMQEYVVNRDGVYYVGKWCFPNLEEVGVSAKSLWLGGGGVDIDAASWRAEAETDGVDEFELFAEDQDGVRVLADSGARPIAEEVGIYVLASGARWRSIELVLGDLEPGYVVASGAGEMSWDEFMAMPNGDFGCR